MNDLKPCPFCGGEASLDDVSDFLGAKTLWAPGCDGEDCLASILWGKFETQREAITAWNTRHRIASQAELVEALRNILGCFDIKDGLSVRDEQTIKHAAAALAKAEGRS